MGHFGRRRLYQKIARQDCKPLPKGRAARRLLTAPPFHPPRREKAAPARSLARLKADFIVETAIERGVKIVDRRRPARPDRFRLCADRARLGPPTRLRGVFPRRR